MRRLSIFFLLCALVLTISITGCQHLLPAPRVPLKVIQPTPEESADYERPVKSDIHGQYLLEPSDVIRVEVRGHEDLSGTMQIRPDGKVTMPLIDDVQVSGLTPLQVDEMITEHLKKYLKEVDVSVSVLQFLSKQVHFIGPTGNAVQIPYSGEMTVLDLITRVGGIPQISAPENTVVVRGDINNPEMIKVNLKDVVYRGDFKDNIMLRENDIVILPANFFSQIGLTVDNFIRGASAPANALNAMTANPSALRGFSDELERNWLEAPFHFHKPRGGVSPDLFSNE